MYIYILLKEHLRAKKKLLGVKTGEWNHVKRSNYYRWLEVDRVHVPRLAEEVRGRVYYARKTDSR